MIFIEIGLYIFLFGIGGGAGWYLGEFIIKSSIDFYKGFKKKPKNIVDETNKNLSDSRESIARISKAMDDNFGAGHGMSN